MPPLLLDALYLPIALLYVPLLLYQMIVLRKNRRGWRQRFGFLPKRMSDRPCIWIHAVSLGEVNACRSLVAEIEQRLDDCDVVISTTTDTGYAAALRQFNGKLVFRFPLDFSSVVIRAFDRISPSAIILMELEVWPNFIALATKRRIPVGIANGRVTHGKSMRRFRMPVVRSLAKKMFSRLSWIAAQNQTYAERFTELGARPEAISVIGTMKYDTAQIADRLPGDDALAMAMAIDRTAPLIVAGSTGPGEETIVIDAYAKLRSELSDLQLVIVPRKPERFEEVAQLIASRGFVCRRRSRHPNGTDAIRVEGTSTSPAIKNIDHSEPRSGEPATIILGDTMGELRKFYVLADVVFVGRSLVPMGGSDLMEVAALARPMCYGPHTENFSDVAEKLASAQAALRCDGPDHLVETLRTLLTDPTAAKEIGRRAREVVRQNTGATLKTVDLLCESLETRKCVTKRVSPISNSH